MEKDYKFHCTVCEKSKKTGEFICLGFVNGNSIAEIRRHVKKDANYKYRNHGIIYISDNGNVDLRMNSNKF